MGLFSFIKKKKTNQVQIAIVNHYFYAVIVTNKPYEINDSKFISFDEVRNALYKDMNFFFFKISNLKECLVNKMQDNKYFDKIYFYSICIQPINEDSQDLTKEIFRNRFESINVDVLQIKKKDMYILHVFLLSLI